MCIRDSLDEAQYIKNAMSVGAGAVKQLKAQTRFALTGTPMENNPAMCIRDRMTARVAS